MVERGDKRAIKPLLKYHSMIDDAALKKLGATDDQIHDQRLDDNIGALLTARDQALADTVLTLGALGNKKAILPLHNLLKDVRAKKYVKYHDSRKQRSNDFRWRVIQAKMGFSGDDEYFFVTIERYVTYALVRLEDKKGIVLLIKQLGKEFEKKVISVLDEFDILDNYSEWGVSKESLMDGYREYFDSLNNFYALTEKENVISKLHHLGYDEEKLKEMEESIKPYQEAKAMIKAKLVEKYPNSPEFLDLIKGYHIQKVIDYNGKFDVFYEAEREDEKEYESLKTSGGYYADTLIWMPGDDGKRWRTIPADLRISRIVNPDESGSPDSFQSSSPISVEFSLPDRKILEGVTRDVPEPSNVPQLIAILKQRFGEVVKIREWEDKDAQGHSVMKTTVSASEYRAKEVEQVIKQLFPHIFSTQSSSPVIQGIGDRVQGTEDTLQKVLDNLANVPVGLIGALEENGQILSVKAGEVFDIGFGDYWNQVMKLASEHSEILTISGLLAAATGITGGIYYFWSRHTVSGNIWRLKSENPKVREAAAYALWRLGDIRAVDPLKKALEDKVLYVKEAVSKALRELPFEVSDERPFYEVRTRQELRPGYKDTSHVASDLYYSGYVSEYRSPSGKEVSKKEAHAEILVEMTRVNVGRRSESDYTKAIVELSYVLLDLDELPYDHKERYDEIKKALEEMAIDPNSQYLVGLKLIESVSHNTILWAIRMLVKSGLKKAIEPLKEMLHFESGEGPDHWSSEIMVAEDAAEALEKLAGTDLKLQYEIGLEGLKSPWTSIKEWGQKMIDQSGLEKLSDASGIDMNEDESAQSSSPLAEQQGTEDRVSLDSARDSLRSQGAEIANDERRNTDDEDVGGIDMNAIDLERQGAGVDIQFDPAELQEIIDAGIDGFAPVIINITPLPSVLPLLGLEPAKQEDGLEVSSLN